jgi:ParB family chromosome partitioning protein
MVVSPRSPAMKVAENSVSAMLNVDRITIDEQPRTRFDAQTIEELAQTMREQGLLQPLIVRKVIREKGRYQLITGERRLRAAKLLRWKEIACIVRDPTKVEAMEMQLVENEQREDLTPIEKAQHYRKMLALRDKNGKRLYTLDTLAARVGKKRRTIEWLLKLCDLPKEGRDAVESRRLAPRTAYLVTRIRDQKAQREFTRDILHPSGKTEPLSYREAEELLSRDYLRNLRKATFDTKDATLVPVQYDKEGERIIGGACTDCPFAEHTQGRSICTNPSCFDLKLERSCAGDAGQLGVKITEEDLAQWRSLPRPAKILLLWQEAARRPGLRRLFLVLLASEGLREGRVPQARAILSALAKMSEAEIEDFVIRQKLELLGQREGWGSAALADFLVALGLTAEDVENAIKRLPAPSSSNSAKIAEEVNKEFIKRVKASKRRKQYLPVVFLNLENA